MAERKVTRRELIHALSLIGINVNDGGGIDACHQFGFPSIKGINSYGSSFVLNGETSDSFTCLIVQVKD